MIFFASLWIFWPIGMVIVTINCLVITVQLQQKLLDLRLSKLIVWSGVYLCLACSWYLSFWEVNVCTCCTSMKCGTICHLCTLVTTIWVVIIIMWSSKYYYLFERSMYARVAHRWSVELNYLSLVHFGHYILSDHHHQPFIKRLLSDQYPPIIIKICVILAWLGQIFNKYCQCMHVLHIDEVWI